MERFIETCRDEALAIRLARASAGGLDRFLSVLDHAPEEEYQRWEAFYRPRCRARALAWLAGHGIEPCPPFDGGDP